MKATVITIAIGVCGWMFVRGYLFRGNEQTQCTVVIKPVGEYMEITAKPVIKGDLAVSYIVPIKDLDGIHYNDETLRRNK